MKRGWSFRKQQDREHFLNHGPSNGSLTNQSIENSCYVDLKVFLCNHFLTFLLNLSFRICARKRYNQYDIKFWSTTSSCSRCTSTCARAQWRGMQQIFIQNQSCQLLILTSGSSYLQKNLKLDSQFWAKVQRRQLHSPDVNTYIYVVLDPNVTGSLLMRLCC